MQFTKSESQNRPREVEAISGDRFFVRKDIKEIHKTDDEGNISVAYQYDEAVVTAPEYAAFAAVAAVESRREAEIIDEYTLKLIDEGVI